MRDPDKQRYLNAARRVQTGQIPFQELDPDIVLIEDILGKSFHHGLRSYDIPPADIADLYTRMGCDMVYVANLWELGRRTVVDETGRKHYADGLFKRPEDITDIRLPDLGQARQKFEAVREAIEGTGLGLIAAAQQAPVLVTAAIGYQDYCLTLMDNPGFVHEFQEKIDDYCVRELEVALSCGADAIQIAINVCMNTGLMYSREMIEEFEYPLLRRNIAMAKQHGASKKKVHMGAAQQVSIIENNNEYAVLEIVCSCGAKTPVRCEYVKVQSSQPEQKDTE